MTTPALQVRQLAKEYVLGGRPPARFWALRDVSFDVAIGEVMGVIGANGAGKSTLLKILSRITEPTSGQVEILGRVASLLEVGTGFHPELTGRENVYLNGTILGMSRDEIQRKFDEIVAFAEVEAFLETPVKHYSSGMYLRLAFAVAASLEPEILIVDEVLAVGDVRFQKRCLDRMKDVAGQGRTVLLVSHNMNAVQSLCSRALLLEAGRVKALGPTDAVVSEYLATALAGSAEADLASHPARVAGTEHAFRRVFLHDVAGTPRSTFPMGGDVYITLEVALSRPVTNPVIGIGFRSEMGHIVLIAGSFAIDHPQQLGAGSHRIVGRLPNMMLTPGLYSLILDLRGEVKNCIDRIEDAIGVVIEPRDLWGSGWLPAEQNRAWIAASSWRVERSDELTADAGGLG